LKAAGYQEPGGIVAAPGIAYAYDLYCHGEIIHEDSYQLSLKPLQN
jgi:hypothetical protein